MGLLILGYGVAATAFYVFIAKTAKLQPDLLVISNPVQQGATIIDITEHYEKKAA